MVTSLLLPSVMLDGDSGRFSRSVILAGVSTSVSTVLSSVSAALADFVPGPFTLKLVTIIEKLKHAAKRPLRCLFLKSFPPLLFSHCNIFVLSFRDCLL